MQVCVVHCQSVINSFRGTSCTCADCTSRYLRVSGASVGEIADSRKLSRKSSTVTILHHGSFILTDRLLEDGTSVEEEKQEELL